MQWPINVAIFHTRIPSYSVYVYRRRKGMSHKHINESNKEMLFSTSSINAMLVVETLARFNFQRKLFRILFGANFAINVQSEMMKEIVSFRCETHKIPSTKIKEGKKSK